MPQNRGLPALTHVICWELLQYLTAHVFPVLIGIMDVFRSWLGASWLVLVLCICWSIGYWYYTRLRITLFTERDISPMQENETMVKKIPVNADLNVLCRIFRRTV